MSIFIVNKIKNFDTIQINSYISSRNNNDNTGYKKIITYMKVDFVIYHNKVAYTNIEALKKAIGENNANKAFTRALAQKVDVTSWSLRKCGKYEIHLK